MNFKEYVQNAVRTESKFNIISHETVSIYLNDRLLHSAIWMQTELWEIFEAIFIKWKWKDLDYVNLREEIGDVMWYFAILCDNLGYFDYELDKLNNIKKFDNLNDYVFEINNITINVLDSVKKSLFYKKTLDLDLLKNRLTDIFNYLWNLLIFLWGDLEKTCIINIEKLKARYPDKFTTENAVNRNLWNERNILENDK